MIWVVLAALGIPLWLCAIGILSLVIRNRGLRKRHNNIPVRVRRPGKKRWAPGHAIWISDVFAWRTSPAGWSEDLLQVKDASFRVADAEESKKLHRLGGGPVIASLELTEGGSLEVAARVEEGAGLLGPFSSQSDEAQPAPVSKD